MTEGDGEARRNEGDELFAVAFRLSPDALFVMHVRDRTVLRASDSVLALWGVTAVEAEGKCVDELMTWHDESARARFLAQIRATGECLGLEATGTMGGMARDISISGRYVVFNDEPCALIAMRDLTARNAARAAADVARTRFDSFMQAYPAAAWIRDVEGRYVYVNPAWRRASGSEDADPIGLPPAIVLRDEEARLAERLDAAALASPDQLLTVRQEGFDRVWSTTRFVFEGDSGEQLIGGVAADITEREAAQAELARLHAELEQRVIDRTAQLEAANRELEAFSYSVSHDLRAPLRAIVGFGQLLQRRHGDRLDEQGVHYLDNIVTAGERMGALIEDLLSYARLERGATRRVAVPVGPLVDAICATLAERIGPTGAVVEIVRPLITPSGDPTLIGQILTNLIDNALTYRRKDVALAVTVSCRSTSADHQWGEGVEISVSDNGIGIAAEHHGRIFDVFQRLHTDDDYPGTGIGLAIAEKAARLMGSALTVVSELGVGSTFKFWLPSAGDLAATSS